MNIREALQSDVMAITALYNAWIPTSTITWTEELDTPDKRSDWLESQRAHDFPVFVAEVAGEVVGFATYEYFRGEGKWPGYRLTVEQSIHVSESHWGTGVGRALVAALIERARSDGMHVLVAGIDSENAASIQFHSRLGFIEVARMPHTGQKFGRWLDLVLMQRILDDRRRP